MPRFRSSQKKSKSKGDSLEDYLRQTHDIMLENGLGRVRKVPSPVRITGSKGNKVTGRKLPSEWSDYTGTLSPGLSVVFEAKASGDDAQRFDFGVLESKGSGLNQIDVLRQHASTGAITFVYVRHHFELIKFNDYILPVNAKGEIAGEQNDSDVYGSRSIRFEDIPDLFKVPKLGDWSDAVEEILLSDDRNFFEDIAAEAVEMFLSFRSANRDRRYS